MRSSPDGSRCWLVHGAAPSAPGVADAPPLAGGEAERRRSAHRVADEAGAGDAERAPRKARRCSTRAACSRILEAGRVRLGGVCRGRSHAGRDHARSAAPAAAHRALPGCRRAMSATGAAARESAPAARRCRPRGSGRVPRRPAAASTKRETQGESSPRRFPELGAAHAGEPLGHLLVVDDVADPARRRPAMNSQLTSSRARRFRPASTICSGVEPGQLLGWPRTKLPEHLLAEEARHLAVARNVQPVREAPGREHGDTLARRAQLVDGLAKHAAEGVTTRRRRARGLHVDVDQHRHDRQRSAPGRSASSAGRRHGPDEAPRPWRDRSCAAPTGRRKPRRTRGDPAATRAGCPCRRTARTRPATPTQNGACRLMLTLNMWSLLPTTTRSGLAGDDAPRPAPGFRQRCRGRVPPRPRRHQDVREQAPAATSRPIISPLSRRRDRHRP